MLRVKNWFGTSGIRGLIDKEIDELFAARIGWAMGKYLGRGKALVGYDPRPGAEKITQAVVSGLTRAGIKVKNLGIIGTPELTWYQVKGGYDLGVSVTGSHLPWEMIGIIPTLKDGQGIGGEASQKISKIYQNFNLTNSPARAVKNVRGKISHAAYLKAILAAVDAPTIKRRGYRILFDPANGSAIEVGRQLFGQLGKLIMVNDRLGQKPPRPPEPRRGTLAATAKLVVKNHCDLGIATDVDADRVVFIDETGTILAEDLAAVILAEGKTAVTPVNSSGIFKSDCAKKGIKLFDCPVGPPAIIAAIKKHRADFAYEESGKYFFCRHWLWADGLLAGAKMLEALVRSGKSLSQIRQSYPEYFQIKLAIACPWEKMPARWIGVGEKKQFGDSFLFIRASGTEPLIRVFSDSPQKPTALALASQGKTIVLKELAK
jgi:phosphomannomutase/phosphoglucomutase